MLVALLLDLCKLRETRKSGARLCALVCARVLVWDELNECGLSVFVQADAICCICLQGVEINVINLLNILILIIFVFFWEFVTNADGSGKLCCTLVCATSLCVGN